MSIQKIPIQFVRVNSKLIMIFFFLKWTRYLNFKMMNLSCVNKYYRVYGTKTPVDGVGIACNVTSMWLHF